MVLLKFVTKTKFSRHQRHRGHDEPVFQVESQLLVFGFAPIIGDTVKGRSLVVVLSTPDDGQTSMIGINSVRLVSCVRQSQSFYRYVLIVWLMAGDDRIRVHDGVAYLYHPDGAFDAFKGIAGESLYQRLKNYLLVLEGVFRRTAPETKRDPACMWIVIVKQITEDGGEKAWFGKCTDAAIFSLGSGQGGRSARGPRGGGAVALQEGDLAAADGDGVANVKPWPIFIAESIAATGSEP